MVEDVAMFARNFSCVKVSKDSVIVFDSAMIIYIILFFNCMLRERDVIVTFFFFAHTSVEITGALVLVGL